MGAPPVRAGALQLSTISDPVHSTRAMADGADGTSGGSIEAGKTRTRMTEGCRSCEIERRKGVEIHTNR